MARIKLELPDTFSFTAKLSVRITDLNYGGHVGNDTILSYLHEARMKFLENAGYSELNIGGTGLIMSNVAIEFKNELFYGDELICHVTATDFSRVGFDIFYRLEKQSNGQTLVAAVAKTGMICYDYSRKKVAAVPAGVQEKLS